MRFPLSLSFLIWFWACSSQQKSEPAASLTDNVAMQPDILNDSVRMVTTDTALLESLFDLDSDEDIVARFGHRISHREEFSSEVEESWQVTQLFPKSRNEVTFEWRDAEKFKGLYSITISGTSSDWKTKSGVKLGMKRADLEQLNGKPFLFYYLGWNFQGQVFWNAGSLANHGMHVIVGPQDNGHVDQGLFYPQAPEQISSNSEAAKNSDLIVKAISFRKDERPTQ
ncbi:MAG TPA: hypothetical protein VFU05_15885 [Cyclobacteriaceae bacterium]|nr:hypothetical protein [Cyclobacteriaceae bacterium]